MITIQLVVPLATDDVATFNWKGFQWMMQLPDWSTQVNSTAAQVNADAGIASAAALQAVASAASAAAAGNSNKWVSGTAYAADVGVFSPINYRPYRRKSAGGGVTDPSIDSVNWADIGSVPAVGTGGTTLTGNVTLTASSPAAIAVTPASAGLGVTLADATTCTQATNNVAVNNLGDFDYAVRNYVGTTLGWVRPRSSAVIGLADKSTSAGIWVPVGLEKLGMSAQVILPTITNVSAGSPLKMVALDANRTLFLFGNTYTYAMVYDASTAQWGAPASLSTTGANGGYAGVLVGTDKVLVAYCVTSVMYLNVLTITGTSVGPGTAANTAISVSGGAIEEWAAVGTSFVLLYNPSSTHALLAVTVSGTTPSFGSAAALPYACDSKPNLYVSGSVIRTVAGAWSSSAVAFAKPWTVSGTGLSPGTVATVAMSAQGWRSYLNGNGNIVLGSVNSSLQVTVFKLTGTVEAGSTVNVASGYTAANAASFELLSVAAGKTLAWFIDSSSATTTRYNVVTDTAGTASAGTAISLTHPTATLVAGLGVSGTTAYALISGASNTFATMVVHLDCSGASPVIVKQLPSSLNVNTNFDWAPLVASNSASNRDKRHLRASNASSYFVGNGGYPWDLHVTPNRINKRLAPLMVPDYGAGYVNGSAGLAANESWFVGGLNSASVGFVIYKVEAVA